MNPEEIVSFFARRGHRVVQTPSCWWYDEYRQRSLYTSFPTHRPIDPTPAEIAELFHRLPSALGVRFVAAGSRGHQSFNWVRRKPYDLAALSSKSRNQTRRGMERCQLKALSWEELVALAGEAHSDTMKRHRTNGAESLGFDVQLSECPAYEAWGAFIDGRLAAYAVTLSVEDCVQILLQRSVTAYLKFYPNNALIFSVVSELLSRPGVTTVSFGLEPLVSHDSLAHFKAGMGFAREPVYQRVVLAKRARLLLNPVSSRSIEVLANLLPGNPRLQKVAGICRIARKS